jgi:hypothetical protein
MHSEGDDSGWWSDSNGDDEDGGMRRRSWLRKSEEKTSAGEAKLLRKENFRLREEVERLEAVLEDCSMALGMDMR